MHCLPTTDWGDKLFATALFYISHGRLPRNQFLFNDFMYHMKASGELKNPLRVFVSDKEFVKMYVKARVGDAYNVPTLAVLRSAEEVDAFEFPADCCIKATHGSKQIIICRGNQKPDTTSIKTWLTHNYYKGTRERNYKTLNPKVIVEPIIFNGCQILDYRFFCLHGRVKFILVDVGTGSDDIRRAAFDTTFNQLDFSIRYPRPECALEKPEAWGDMLEVAEMLSEPFAFIRVDMYAHGPSFYVGELTNCHANAGSPFFPAEGEVVASRLLFG